MLTDKNCDSPGWGIIKNDLSESYVLDLHLSVINTEWHSLLFLFCQWMVFVRALWRCQEALSLENILSLFSFFGSLTYFITLHEEKERWCLLLCPLPRLIPQMKSPPACYIAAVSTATSSTTRTHPSAPVVLCFPRYLLLKGLGMQKLFVDFLRLWGKLILLIP